MTAEKVTADEIWLRNGDHITGKVVTLEKNELTISTSYAGDLTIPWEEIANLRTDEPVKVVIGEATITQGMMSRSEEGKVAIQSEDLEEPLTIELAQVKSINPKPPAPPLKTKARVNFGASFTDGNTETEDIYGDGEFVARTEKNRYTLGGRYKRSQDNNIKTADSLIGYMKYDHFFTKKWYFYANAEGEKDEFKDLDLRTSLGLGAGYQFLETEWTHLSLEAGVSYVNEDFIEAEDEGYAAGRWGFRFDRHFFNKAFQIFHNHTGLVGLEDTDDLIIYSQTGVRIPFYKNLNVTAQFNYDYDNTPATGREKEDKAYIFTLGYQWED
jgi:putative salt-induced outer membrane protein YdiY